jgi:hypothetical protein
LLIAHQDELEAQLVALFEERDPSVIGNDYLRRMAATLGVTDLLERAFDEAG